MVLSPLFFIFEFSFLLLIFSYFSVFLDIFQVKSFILLKINYDYFNTLYNYFKYFISILSIFSS